MSGLPDHIWCDALACVIFGIIAVVVMVVGTLGLDWAYRKVDLQAEIKKGNVSAAIVLAAVIIGLAIVMASVVKSVIGN